MSWLIRVTVLTHFVFIEMNATSLAHDDSGKYLNITTGHQESQGGQVITYSVYKVYFRQWTVALVAV